MQDLASGKNILLIHAAEDAGRDKYAPASLLIRLSPTNITTAIVEQEHMRFSFFKDIQVKDTAAALADEEIMKEALPDARPARVLVFIDNRNTLTVPTVLFEDWMSSDLYKAHRRQDVFEKIISAPMPRLQAHMIFGIPWAWERGVKQIFPDAQFMHTDLPWLEMLSQMHKNEPDTYVHVDIDPDGLHLAIYRDNALQLYNTYQAEKAEDWLYFVLAAAEQLRVNPLRDIFYLSGHIDRGGRIYELFSNYIRDIRLEARPGIYNYCMPMQDIPEQLYFKFLTSPICV